MSTAASRPRSEPARLIVVMGVSGCGKSDVGAALAAALGGTFLDGDAYHPQSNIEKMSRGDPLTDEDRWPWLDRFARELAKRRGRVIGGCSALKRAYRERIASAAGQPVLFVHLAGSKALIAERMNARSGHFMPPSLLDSQFNTLEAPGSDENAITVDIDGSVDQIVEDIMTQFEARRVNPPA